MAGLEDITNKAKDLLGGNADKVGDAVDQATDVVDDKTGGKSAPVTEKIDSAVDDALGGGS